MDERIPLALTLVVLLLRPPDLDWLRVVTWAVAGSGLVVRAWLDRSELWSIVAALVGTRLIVDWPLADNHIYLLFYWVLAVTLALRTSRPFPTLARSARWLVGLTFLFAVLWKAVLAPEYLDGRFFRVTLLTDDRFTWLAQTAGGYTDQQMHDNRAALEPVPEGTEVLNGPTLVLTPSFERLALAMTWGGLLLESCVALLFLAPVAGRLATLRHVLLCAFCFCTYTVAPVAGFGWLLAIMGLAQCAHDRRALRLSYLAAFIVVGLFGEAPDALHFAFPVSRPI